MKVLVTGGTGLVGSRLTALLQSLDYKVVHLSRTPKSEPVKTFVWDINHYTMDQSALEGVDYVIHLAGSGVADGRWTTSRKKEILESRTKSSQLLIEAIRKGNHPIKGFVAASAVGRYGMDTGDQVCMEDTPRGNDFLAEVVAQWEDVTSQVRTLGVPTAQLRIGIVLDSSGGALAKIEQPLRFGMGAPLGSGKQWMSWIHVDDLCRMIIHVMENGKDEVYNAVAPNPVTNAELTGALARQLNKPLFMPNVPSFMIKLMFGEMAMMILGGNWASSQKIEATGFKFDYPTLDQGLNDIYTD